MVKKVVVRVPDKLHRDLKAIAAQQDTTVQEIITRLVEGFVQKNVRRVAERMIEGE